MKRPPRTLVNWLRAPSDISTERTRAWSPPTRACETLRVGGDPPACATPVEVVPIPGVSGPGGLTGGRNLPLLRFLPLRLTAPSLVKVENRQAVEGAIAASWGATRGEIRLPVSLGRGTQPAETLATICCVPRRVITPNVVVVKSLNSSWPCKNLYRRTGQCPTGSGDLPSKWGGSLSPLRPQS